MKLLSALFSVVNLTRSPRCVLAQSRSVARSLRVGGTKLFLPLFLAVPCLTHAQFTFTTNADNTITITGYTGLSGTVVIPSMTNGYPVTGIGTNAFYRNPWLASLTIPGSVVTIGDYAFYKCLNLESVTIGTNVTSIGDYAFAYCSLSLTTVTIPDSVTNIGDSAFYYCTSLGTVMIGNGVTTIEDNAFNNCQQLRSITIGKGRRGPVGRDVCLQQVLTEQDGVVPPVDKDQVGGPPPPHQVAAELV